MAGRSSTLDRTKKEWKISTFHQGLNTKDSKTALTDNELLVSSSITPRTFGKLQMLGDWVPLDSEAVPEEYRDIHNPGFGLFYFKTDYRVLAPINPQDLSEGGMLADTIDTYERDGVKVMLIQSGQKFNIRQEIGSEVLWSYEGLDISSVGEFTQGVELENIFVPSFYFVENGLRVCDSNFSNELEDKNLLKILTLYNADRFGEEAVTGDPIVFSGSNNIFPGGIFNADNPSEEFLHGGNASPTNSYWNNTSTNVPTCSPDGMTLGETVSSGERKGGWASQSYDAAPNGIIDDNCAEFLSHELTEDERPLGGGGWKHPLYVAGFDMACHELINNDPGTYQDFWGNVYGGISFGHDNEAQIGIVAPGEYGVTGNRAVPWITSWYNNVPPFAQAAGSLYGYCYWAYFQGDDLNQPFFQPSGGSVGNNLDNYLYPGVTNLTWKNIEHWYPYFDAWTRARSGQKDSFAPIRYYSETSNHVQGNKGVMPGHSKFCPAWIGTPIIPSETPCFGTVDVYFDILAIRDENGPYWSPNGACMFSGQGLHPASDGYAYTDTDGNAVVAQSSLDDDDENHWQTVRGDQTGIHFVLTTLGKQKHANAGYDFGNGNVTPLWRYGAAGDRGGIDAVGSPILPPPWLGDRTLTEVMVEANRESGIIYDTPNWLDYWNNDGTVGDLPGGQAWVQQNNHYPEFPWRDCYWGSAKMAGQDALALGIYSSSGYPHSIGSISVPKEFGRGAIDIANIKFKYTAFGTKEDLFLADSKMEFIRIFAFQNSDDELISPNLLEDAILLGQSATERASTLGFQVSYDGMVGFTGMDYTLGEPTFLKNSEANPTYMRYFHSNDVYMSTAYFWREDQRNWAAANNFDLDAYDGFWSGKEWFKTNWGHPDKDHILNRGVNRLGQDGFVELDVTDNYAYEVFPGIFHGDADLDNDNKALDEEGFPEENWEFIFKANTGQVSTKTMINVSNENAYPLEIDGDAQTIVDMEIIKHSNGIDGKASDLGEVKAYATHSIAEGNTDNTVAPIRGIKQSLSKEPANWYGHDFYNTLVLDGPLPPGTYYLLGNNGIDDGSDSIEIIEILDSGIAHDSGVFIEDETFTVEILVDYEMGTSITAELIPVYEPLTFTLTGEEKIGYYRAIYLFFNIAGGELPVDGNGDPIDLYFMMDVPVLVDLYYDFINGSVGYIHNISRGENPVSIHCFHDIGVDPTEIILSSGHTVTNHYGHLYSEDWSQWRTKYKLTVENSDKYELYGFNFYQWGGTEVDEIWGLTDSFWMMITQGEEAMWNAAMSGDFGFGTTIAHYFGFNTFSPHEMGMFANPILNWVTPMHQWIQQNGSEETIQLMATYWNELSDSGNAEAFNSMLRIWPVLQGMGGIHGCGNTDTNLLHGAKLIQDKYQQLFSLDPGEIGYQGSEMTEAHLLGRLAIHKIESIDRDKLEEWHSNPLMHFNLDNFKAGEWIQLNNNNNDPIAAFKNLAITPIFYTKIYDSGATLAEAIDKTEKLITVSDGTKFNVDDNIQWQSSLDSNLRETVKVTEINSNTLTVIRSQYDFHNEDGSFVTEQEALSGTTIYIVPDKATVCGGVVPIEYDIDTFKTNYEAAYPDFVAQHPAFASSPEEATQMFRDEYNALFVNETDEWKATFWGYMNQFIGI